MNDRLFNQLRRRDQVGDRDGCRGQCNRIGGSGGWSRPSRLVARTILPGLLVPQTDGGVLSGKGMVEVVSSLERDGRAVVNDLVAGVYTVIETDNPYVRRCFSEYKWQVDATGGRTALTPAGPLYRPGDQDQHCQRRAARRTDRSTGRFQRRRGGGRQEGPRAGRGTGWARADFACGDG